MQNKPPLVLFQRFPGYNHSYCSVIKQTFEVESTESKKAKKQDFPPMHQEDMTEQEKKWIGTK